MAGATLNISVLPRRILKTREAAAYCGLSPKRFSVECPVAPVTMPDDSRQYDMRDLDRWLDSLKDDGDDDDGDIVARLG